jgi:hypothetical protein
MHGKAKKQLHAIQRGHIYIYIQQAAIVNTYESITEEEPYV